MKNFRIAKHFVVLCVIAISASRAPADERQNDGELKKLTARRAWLEKELADVNRCLEELDEGRWKGDIRNWLARWRKFRWDMNALERKFRIENVQYDVKSNELVFLLTAKVNVTYDEKNALRVKASDDNGIQTFPLADQEFDTPWSMKEGAKCYFKITSFTFVMSDQLRSGTTTMTATDAFATE